MRSIYEQSAHHIQYSINNALANCKCKWEINIKENDSASPYAIDTIILIDKEQTNMLFNTIHIIIQ